MIESKGDLSESLPQGEFPGCEIDELPKVIPLRSDIYSGLGLKESVDRYFNSFRQHILEEAKEKGRDIIAYRPQPDKKVIIIAVGAASLAIASTVVGITIYKHIHKEDQEKISE